MSTIFTQSEIKHYLSEHRKDLANYQQKVENFNPTLCSQSGAYLAELNSEIAIITSHISFLEKLQH